MSDLAHVTCSSCGNYRMRHDLEDGSVLYECPVCDLAGRRVGIDPDHPSVRGRFGLEPVPYRPSRLRRAWWRATGLIDRMLDV
jgi:hypothetical protein